MMLAPAAAQHQMGWSMAAEHSALESLLSARILLPFLAYFGATGDESRRKRTKVSGTQVVGETRISAVLLAF